MSDGEPAVRGELRAGAYHDSVVLLGLQAALAELPGVLAAGVAMGTPTNLALLADRRLLPAELATASPEDLVVAVAAESGSAAEAALARVDELLARRRSSAEAGYRPRSLEAALKALPEARWVLVSVPGRYAAGVAGEALDRGRNVFLFSDNVAVEDEVRLKAQAANRGLLVLGPDCGTAIVSGTGLGFANRVRRGPVGIVAASGTGLQAVTSRLDALGCGVSQALGTGGRDLAAGVGGATAVAALDLLSRDPATEVVVLVSKPPDRSVAARLLAAAWGIGKPVVVAFLGFPPPARRLGDLHFAAGLADAAGLAAELATSPPRAAPAVAPPAGEGRCLRGLFSGGTLAGEALRGLALFLDPLSSNLAAPGVERLTGPARGRGHTVVDLGADELTVGRLHPMMDPGLLVERLAAEAADPEVGLVLLDVVLGDGAHPDPAGAVAPVLAEARRSRGDELETAVVLVGTEADPQGRADQEARLAEAGARIFRGVDEAIAFAVERLAARPAAPAVPVGLEALAAPLVAVNAGVEAFAASLAAQGARVVHMEFRPPAGGDDRMAALLARLRAGGGRAEEPG